MPFLWALGILPQRWSTRFIMYWNLFSWCLWRSWSCWGRLPSSEEVRGETYGQHGVLGITGPTPGMQQEGWCKSKTMGQNWWQLNWNWDWLTYIPEFFKNILKTVISSFWYYCYVVVNCICLAWLSSWSSSFERNIDLRKPKYISDIYWSLFHKLIIFQSRKRLYNHKCPFVRSSVRQSVCLSVRYQNPQTAYNQSFHLTNNHTTTSQHHQTLHHTQHHTHHQTHHHTHTHTHTNQHPHNHASGATFKLFQFVLGTPCTKMAIFWKKAKWPLASKKIERD